MLIVTKKLNFSHDGTNGLPFLRHEGPDSIPFEEGPFGTLTETVSSTVSLNGALSKTYTAVQEIT